MLRPLSHHNCFQLITEVFLPFLSAFDFFTVFHFAGRKPFKTVLAHHQRQTSLSHNFWCQWCCAFHATHYQWYSMIISGDSMAKCRSVGLAIQWLQVQVQLWPLAGFGLGRPEFKSLAMHVNYSHVVASCQLAFWSCYVLFKLFVSNYSSKVPVN